MPRPKGLFGKLPFVADIGFGVYLAGAAKDAYDNNDPESLIEPTAVTAGMVAGNHLFGKAITKGAGLIDKAVNFGGTKLLGKRIATTAASSSLGAFGAALPYGFGLMTMKHYGDQYADKVYEEAPRIARKVRNAVSSLVDKATRRDLIADMEYEDNVKSGIQSGADPGTAQIGAESIFRSESKAWSKNPPKIDLDALTKEWSRKVAKNGK